MKISLEKAVNLFNSPSSKKILWYNRFMLILVLIDALLMILETNKNYHNNINLIIRYSNFFIIFIFSFDLILRLYNSFKNKVDNGYKSKIKNLFNYVFSFYGIIDLMAVLPFYIMPFVAINLSFLRPIRICKSLRILLSFSPLSFFMLKLPY